VDAKAIWLYPPPSGVEAGPNVWVMVGVGDGMKIVGTGVLVGVSDSARVGVAVFVRTGSGVILTTVVEVAVAGRGVGGSSKARKLFETGDRKIKIDASAARIANKKKERNTQKPLPRPGSFRGFEGGRGGGGVASAGGTS